MPTVDLGVMFQLALGIQEPKRCCFSCHCWRRRAELPRGYKSPETFSVSDRRTRSAEWDLPSLMVTNDKGSPSWDSSRLWRQPLVCLEGVKSSNKAESAALTCSGVLKHANCNATCCITSQPRTIVFVLLSCFLSRYFAVAAGK